MPLTYSSYLKLDQLLNLQEFRSKDRERDELLFPITHQVYELWFKQVLHETDHLYPATGKKRPAPRPAHPQAHPHHPQDDGLPTRHSGDDDPDRIPLLPGIPRLLQRVSVGAVPGVGVRAGAQAPAGVESLSGGFPRI